MEIIATYMYKRPRKFVQYVAGFINLLYMTYFPRYGEHVGSYIYIAILMMSSDIRFDLNLFFQGHIIKIASNEIDSRIVEKVVWLLGRQSRTLYHGHELIT